MSLPTGMIEVLRGEVVEARHAVHAVVADADGRVVASVGDPETGAFYRSAAKPLQALPLVEDGVVERFGLTEAELALCCASHEGEPAHVAGARSILAKAGLDESALRCGPHLPFSEEEARTVLRNGGEALPIHNNCSGKHAGMLALAVAHGWDPEGYHAAGHPVQRRMLREIARWSGRRGDGGGHGGGRMRGGVLLRTPAGHGGFVRPLRGSGGARRGSGAHRVGDDGAIPFMVGGTGRACTAVMERTGASAFVKLGAEGVYGAGVPARGLGIAIKVADGARRAVEVALVRVLHRTGVLDSDDLDALARWAEPKVRNTRREVVGAIRPAFDLRWA